jgi:hypothetical protein
MFPVTRPLRQAICTVLLLLVTVVPTALIAAVAWRINQPGHIRDVEIELGRNLGMQVSLRGVSYPRPGEIVYQGVVLRGQEPRGKGFSEIARADAVRLSRADRELTVLLENPELHAASPALGLAILDFYIQRSAALPFERVGLSAPACKIELGGENFHFTFKDVAGEFLSESAAPTLRLAYDIPGNGKGSRCELILTRDRRHEPFETSLAFKTVEGSPLSARMLNVLFDAADWLGDEAKFLGSLNLRMAGSTEWKADFQGEILDLDLARLVERRFPRHHLTGRAKISIEKATWGERPSGQGPGWLEVKGELVAGQGSIGVALLDALAREMRFRPSVRRPHADSRKADVDFRSLGLSFAIHSNGEIQVSGALGTEFPPDAVLAGASSALLSAPQGTASVHGLIKTLFPVSTNNSGVLIPLTTESRALFSLPLPVGADTPARRTLDAN